MSFRQWQADAQGYVELIGVISAGETEELKAPLSGTSCAWLDYKMQCYKRSGKSNHWDTIDQRTSEQCFQINDKTGICTIDPQGAEVFTEHTRVWYEGSEKSMQSENDGNSYLRALNKRRYRYTEKFIYIHDVIYGLGHFQRVGGRTAYFQ